MLYKQIFMDKAAIFSVKKWKMACNFLLLLYDINIGWMTPAMFEAPVTQPLPSAGQLPDAPNNRKFLDNGRHAFKKNIQPFHN